MGRRGYGWRERLGGLSGVAGRRIACAGDQRVSSEAQQRFAGVPSGVTASECCIGKLWDTARSTPAVPSVVFPAAFIEPFVLARPCTPSPRAPPPCCPFRVYTNQSHYSNNKDIYVDRKLAVIYLR